MNLYQGRILTVDLTHRTVKVVSIREEWLEDYVVGMGLAFRYLWEELDPKVDPSRPGMS